MKLTCPNDKFPDKGPEEPFHKHFLVNVTVCQEWKVGQLGEIDHVTQNQVYVSKMPDKSDTYICSTCGSKAKIEE